MKRSVKGSRALEIIRSLRPPIQISEEDSLEVWGPLNAYQYDLSGTVRIHKYATTLVRRGDDQWLFLRQVIAIRNGYDWPGPPTVSETTETSARHWLKENKFAWDEVEQSKVSKGRQVLQSITSWFGGWML
jgi:hypothetical protein